MSLLDNLGARPSPERVVRDHGPAVYRHLKRIFGPRTDVDDAFQAVFVEVLRSLPTFRGHSKLSTWIRRITWNVAYQEMRMRYRRPRTAAFDEVRLSAAGDDNVEENVVRREAAANLFAALEELDPKQRMAVVLHDVEGRTLKEIGKTLGRPLQTVASQLHKGRANLAESIQKRTGEGTSRPGKLESS